MIDISAAGTGLASSHANFSKLAVFSVEEHDRRGERVQYKAKIIPGQIVSGPQFNEPMRVETVRPNGSDAWVVGLVGTQSERFRSVTLSAKDLKTLTISSWVLRP
jgi:hypothetical protein